jgi:soluble lytic murein transglycosylase-like protein
MTGLVAIAVYGQQPTPFDRQDAIRAAMESSAEMQRSAVRTAMEPGLEKQHISVRAQAQGAVSQDASHSFLTLPFPRLAQEADAGLLANCDPLAPAEIDTLVNENARREGLEPDLLREVMRKESGFRPCAVSRVGAQGLMQLMPSTAEQLSVRDPFDPKQNVAAGARFLKSLLERYGGDVSLALGAYNAGPGRVDRAGGVPDIAETKDYVLTILKAAFVR